MDMRIAVALRDKALKDLQDAERMIQETDRDTDLETAINEIDAEISELQDARDVLETKLLKLRIMRGEQSLVTVRQASMITEMGEMTIRTLANPKRAKALELVKVQGDLVKVTVASLRKYIKD